MRTSWKLISKHRGVATEASRPEMILDRSGRLWSSPTTSPPPPPSPPPLSPQWGVSSSLTPPPSPLLRWPAVAEGGRRIVQSFSSWPSTLCLSLEEEGSPTNGRVWNYLHVKCLPISSLSCFTRLPALPLQFWQSDQVLIFVNSGNIWILNCHPLFDFHTIYLV